jgi:hypothetical protein
LIQEALRGDIVVTSGINLWEMNVVDGLDDVEVVIINNFDVWITEFSSHNHLSVVFVPGRPMSEGGVISSVNEVVVITGRLKSIRAFKMHGVKQGTEDFFS